jgi:hypothetical protein
MSRVIQVMVGVLFSMLLSSCGNNPYYEQLRESEIEGFGKTYLYIEHYPIEGIEYECGDLDMDRTDTYGGFMYELGTSCRFYLNNRELFSISGDKLRDGRAYEIEDDELRDRLYDADLNIDPNKIVIAD